MSSLLDEDFTIVSDGTGGALVTWRQQDPEINSSDIYAQRISADGAVQWSASGVALCTAAGHQLRPTIVQVGAGGAIVCWQDARNGSNNGDIYAQRVDSYGLLGGVVPNDAPGKASLGFALDPVRPNPMRGGALTIHFRLNSEAAASLEILDVMGRCIAAREVGSYGTGRHALDLMQGRRLASGLYLVYLRQGSNVLVTRVAVLE